MKETPFKKKQLISLCPRVCMCVYILACMRVCLWRGNGGWLDRWKGLHGTDYVFACACTHLYMSIYLI